MNNCVLIGNLTKDPELRYMNSEKGQFAKCRFTIAESEGWGEKQRTLYFNIVVYGKQAENCNNYLTKGKKVCVNGKMIPGRYQNKEGQWVNTFEIEAVPNGVEFLSPKETKPEQTEIPAGFKAVENEGIPF